MRTPAVPFRNGAGIAARSNFLKRVYKIVAVESAAGGFQVALDGKPLRTPARAPLVLRQRALIEGIAAEWDAQTGIIVPDSMPLMQLVSTAIDRVAPQRERIAANVAQYGATDLVCYRAESPVGLVERQQKVWGPLVDWVRLQFDAPLAVFTGVMPRPQPPETLQALRTSIECLGDLELTALQAVTAASGSLVIALALLKGHINADQAWAASQLDETYQIEKWGEDAEAAKRRQTLLQDMRSAARFLNLARS
jgi:chaperone required for assembly of F1-ATPase